MRGNGNTRMQFLLCVSDGASCVLDARGVLGLSRTEALQRDDMGFGCVGALPGDIPVFTLAHFLGQPTPELRRSMPIVILRNATGAWGLIADRVTQMQDIPAEELFAWPPVLQSADTRCFGALLQHDGKLYPVLRPEAMSSEEVGELPPVNLPIPDRDAAFRNGLPARGGWGFFLQDVFRLDGVLPCSRVRAGKKERGDTPAFKR